MRNVGPHMPSPIIVSLRLRLESRFKDPIRRFKSRRLRNKQLLERRPRTLADDGPKMRPAERFRLPDALPEARKFSSRLFTYK
ncbi:MAG: hypothetical protein C4324_02690 [Blastocatellia bacterium]